MKNILQLSDDERRRIGKEGRKLVKHEFSQEVIIEKYMNLIDTLFLSS